VSQPAGTAPTDTALWQCAVAGDHDAFGRLFDRHSGAVYSYLFRRTADWSAAEDLTAAVFLQAWRKRGQVVFDAESALPWLLGVARQLLRNTVRVRARYQAALARAGAELAASAPPADPAEQVASQVDSEREMARLRQALARLPRQQRETVELCVFAGLDQNAAAIAMGVSVGTVKSRLHRARRSLQADLHQDAISPASTGPGRKLQADLHQDAISPASTGPGRRLQADPRPGVVPAQPAAAEPGHPAATAAQPKAGQWTT
jgi:RNA polymerase sigma factor (sigma-70 family)